MSRVSLQQYRDLLSRSGLLSDEQVRDQFDKFSLSIAADASDGEANFAADHFAKHLEQAGLLTQWQNGKLLRGKHRGFMFGKFRILRMLGSGGMGRVFLAENEMLQRQVALKVLPSKLSREDSMIERFHREARALARLSHPNIVRVHDVDVNKELHYIVMEFVDGIDLQHQVDQQGPLDESTAVELALQVVQGLQHAHDAGLIHRDIKPANLLQNSDGVVKILDLGLAILQSAEDSSITEDSAQGVGTVDFISPEQAIDSHDVDARTDIYSLGCSLYFLLTAKVPFDQDTIAQRLLAHQRGDPKPINDVRREHGLPPVSEQLVRICAKMMAKNPDDRYASSKIVGDAFSFLAQESGDNASAGKQHHARGSGRKVTGASVRPQQSPAQTKHAPAVAVDVTKPPSSADDTMTMRDERLTDTIVTAREYRSLTSKRPLKRASIARSTKPPVVGLIVGGLLVASLVGAMVFFRSSATETAPPPETIDAVQSEEFDPPELTKFVKIGNNTTYHLPSCRHLNDKTNVEFVSVEQLESGFLNPCGTCKPESVDTNTVSTNSKF